MGINEIKMRTIAVVDEITQYLMTFGPLIGDIKKMVLPPFYVRSTVNHGSVMLA